MAEEKQVETVNHQLMVPKESKDVVDLIDKILEKALGGNADWSEYSELLPGLVTAVEGVQKLPAEVKSKHRDDLAAYLVQTIMERVMPAEQIVEEAKEKAVNKDPNA